MQTSFFEQVQEGEGSYNFLFLKSSSLPKTSAMIHSLYNGVENENI